MMAVYYQHTTATHPPHAPTGVCYGPSNMLVSGDIMGRSNQLIEEEIGGVALFMNGDAGDIDPADGMCNGGNESYNYFVGSPLMANKVSLDGRVSGRVCESGCESVCESVRESESESEWE